MERRQAKNVRTSFRTDFAPLEWSLARKKKSGGVVMTPERMIIVLKLTPRRVVQIESSNGIKLKWFQLAYAVLQKHGLLKTRNLIWEDWLVEYRRAKRSHRQHV